MLDTQVMTRFSTVSILIELTISVTNDNNHIIMSKTIILYENIIEGSICPSWKTKEMVSGVTDHSPESRGTEETVAHALS